jgi:hypothetical protein
MLADGVLIVGLVHAVDFVACDVLVIQRYGTPSDSTTS